MRLWVPAASTLRRLLTNGVGAAMNMRVLVALLVSPLFPAVAAALWAGFQGVEFDYDTAAAIVFGCVAVGYVAAFFFGLPLSLLWRRFGWTGVAAGITLGIASAVCVTFVLSVALHPLSRSEVPLLKGFLNLLAFAAPLGAIGGLAFWWFGLRSPNNSLAGDASKATRASG